MAEGDLTFTVRIHDPAEKTSVDLSTNWAVVAVPRSAVGIAKADFVAQYIVPALAELKLLKLT
jgi:hypothetical protein